jgi:hypothetical protein
VFGLLKSILELDFFYQLQNLDTVIHSEIRHQSREIDIAEGHKWLIESIKLRLTDQFKQNWYSTLQISPKALSYQTSSPYNIKFGVEVFKLSNSLQNFTCTFSNMSIFS